MVADDLTGSESLPQRAQRLGKNLGRYLGELIEIQSVLDDVQRLADRNGWKQDCFLQRKEYCLLAYHRRAAQARKRVYISTGIHGDEPAGPLAVRELLRENRWPDAVDVWLCPCLNPTGFPLNTRENALGIDLNCQYLDLAADETRAHITWLGQQPSFDVSLCLHEDWESHGFYVYELNPDKQRSFAEAIVERASHVCPIDPSPMIEGRQAEGGIIRPNLDPTSRPQWPEAFYLLSHKTRLSYTLEAPSDFPLSVRVAALIQGTGAVMDRLADE